MTRFNTDGQTATGRSLFKDKTKKKQAARPADTPAAVQLGEHGRYQIKSGRLSGEYIARAFPKPPTNARRIIAEATGATEEAAIAALHDVIDAREAQRIVDRRVDEGTGFTVPSVDEYREALGQISLSRPQHAMLTALALAGDDGLTDSQMARAAGYKTKSSANRAFEATGLLIAEYLSIDAATQAHGDEAPGAGILGFRTGPQGDQTLGNRTLHPELREVLKAIG
ncbi:hypothetical protein [Roseicyclus marinus]|uniref:hypothetical protein n=1 Tax=Roseicyclus marinus TaxID=2161673 RepID=UPI00240FA7C5|nr:hypothetical protein [Roseicyclus marinus]MDG3041733.1 hypothetical protein [Roseicyclus marinus]